MERRGLRLFLIVAVPAFATSVGRSQRPEARKDPQSRYEPQSGPGAGQKYLEGFVGDWDVTKTFYPQTGEPARAPGTCRQTMIHDHRFLQSEFVFDQSGRKTTGLGLTGFDRSSGRFTTVWTDARQTRMSFRQSREPFDGKQIVLFSRALDEDSERFPPSRTVTRLEDNGRKIVHRQFNAGPDGKERVIMELIMTRKGNASTPAR
jgi:hypothetical protein